MKYKKRIQAKLQTLRASVRIVTYIYIYIYMHETQRSEHENMLFHTRLIKLSRTHAPLRKQCVIAHLNDKRTIDTMLIAHIDEHSPRNLIRCIRNQKKIRKGLNIHDLNKLKVLVMNIFLTCRRADGIYFSK